METSVRRYIEAAGDTGMPRVHSLACGQQHTVVGRCRLTL